MWVASWDELIRFHHSEGFKRLHADCDHFMDLTKPLKALAG